MRVISIFNIKGGCGKTLTAQALIEGLRAKKYKVCAIDLDTQHNLTDSFNFTPSFTINDLILESKPITEVLKTDFIASNLKLALLDISKLDISVFINAFNELKGYYDYVIVDMPPSLNNLANIVLSVSDGLIIPSECDIYNINGVISLLDIVKKNYPSLRVNGVLLTRYNERQKISKALTDLLATIKVNVYKTRIRESVAVKELRAFKEPLLKYDGGKANAIKDYKAFIKEFLESEDK